MENFWVIDLILLENLKGISLSVIISIIIFKYGIEFFQKFIPGFFGTCISNQKTSLYHKPILRGLGIMFPLACIPFLYQIINNFAAHDILLVLLSTLIGFWDDKKNLRQKKKLAIICLLGLTYLFVDAFLFSDDSIDNFFYILNFFLFVFLLLFFNQVDGINGLATSTFIVLLVILNVFIGNILLIIPFLVITIYYLTFNIRGKIGIQGEAGSFFLGATIFIIIQNFQLPFDNILILFLILPILSDISSTTIIRWLHNENLLEGHNNNLYQRLVFKYKSHIPVTLFFSVNQLGFCLLFIEVLNIYSNYYSFIILSLISFIVFNVFLYLSFLIQKKKILS